ncbi:MAG: coproporphyrinogen dehydrogenase HemZ [Clostridia bacterium]|nr:coproporphyrinogen dehydrogenase HemZ [Clostridia bacterium]
MKLIIEGDINSYYLQTLCMLFFPRAKFSNTESIGPETPVAIVKVSSDENTAYAEASLSMGGRTVLKYHSENFSPDVPKKNTLSISASKAFFDAATEFCSYTPPWGILTGVRPTKLAYELIKSGMTKDQTVKSLRSEYLMFPRKAILATDIARVESKIIRNYTDRDCSVYISIPFCPSRCAYCSFISYATKKFLSLIPDYLVAMKREIGLISGLIKSLGMNVVTVYVGGGTPTVLDERQLEDLLDYVSSVFDVPSLHEFTVEAGRADTISAEKLKICKDHGVTRVSVNPQSLSDDILQRVGRMHTVKQFYDAYDLALASGIRYINTDLIIGLPGDDFNTYSKTIENIVKLSPENITAHTFAAKKSSEITVSGSELFTEDYKELAKCVDYTQIITKSAGYIPYYMYRQKNSAGNLENVGFCKKGAECIYNILMMEEVHTIFAAGAGAVTKFTKDAGGSIQRVFNPKYPYEYLSKSREEEYSKLKQQAYGFFGAPADNC